MNTFQQVIYALYVALTEAAGPSALRVANRVLRDAIAEGLIDDPRAISVLEPLSHDDEDEPENCISCPKISDCLSGNPN